MRRRLIARALLLLLLPLRAHGHASGERCEKKKMQNAKGKSTAHSQPLPVLMGPQLAAWLNGFCEPALAAPVVVQGV
jgi:hypothetical protein